MMTAMSGCGARPVPSITVTWSMIRRSAALASSGNSRRAARASSNRYASVVDARIVAGMDHAEDVHAIGRSALQGMDVLAREEDHVAGRDRARTFSFQMTPSPDTMITASS